MEFSEVANNSLPPPPQSPQAAVRPAIVSPNGGVQPVPVPQRASSPSSNFTFSPNSQLGQMEDLSSLSSSWQVPAEVIELRKKQDSDVLKENLVSVSISSSISEKGSGVTSLSAPALVTGGRDAIALRASGVPGSSALDLVKKKLHESGAQVTSFSTNASSGSALLEVNGSKTVEPTAKGLQSEGSKDKPKVAEGDGNISDSSSGSEDEDSGPTKEERIAQFKNMLKKRGVAPFSKWDKELQKIVFDPRFKDPSLKRAYEEKMQAEREIVVANFKSMLKERGDITASSRWSKVKDGFRDDNRYKAVNHDKREAVFNEYISELKAANDEVERKAKAKKDEQEKLEEQERELQKRKEREEQEMERVRMKVRRKEAVSTYQALLVETINKHYWLKQLKILRHLGRSQNLNLRKIHKGVHPILI